MDYFRARPILGIYTLWRWTTAPQSMMDFLGIPATKHGVGANLILGVFCTSELHCCALRDDRVP